MSDQNPPPNPINSLTRLVFGALLISNDQLDERIRTWEQRTNQALTQRYQEESGHQSSRRVITNDETGTDPRLTPRTAVPAMTAGDTVRYALVGLVADVASRLPSGNLSSRLGPLDSMATPLLKSLNENELLAPARRQFDELVMRGERQVNDWVARGQAEEAYSRQFAQTALLTTVETSITEVVENPRVVQLVQTRSADVLTVLIEEIRERSISLDSWLERRIRLIFKRIGFRIAAKARDPSDETLENVRALQIAEIRRHAR